MGCGLTFHCGTPAEVRLKTWNGRKQEYQHGPEGNKLRRLEQLGLPGRDGWFWGFEARGLKKLRLEKALKYFWTGRNYCNKIHICVFKENLKGYR